MDRYVKHEQKVYASPEFGAQRKTLNSFVLLRGEQDEREEVRSGKVLLLFHCSVKGESNGGEFTFVRYVDSMEPLREAGEVLECL